MDWNPDPSMLMVRVPLASVFSGAHQHVFCFTWGEHPGAQVTDELPHNYKLIKMRAVILELTELASWGVSVILNLTRMYQQKANWRMVLRPGAAHLYYKAEHKHGDHLQPKMYLFCHGQWGMSNNSFLEQVCRSAVCYKTCFYFILACAYALRLLLLCV